MTVFKYFIKSMFRMKLFFGIWIGIFALITASNLGEMDRKSEEKFKETSFKVAMAESIGGESFEDLKEYFGETAKLSLIADDKYVAKESVFLGGYDIVFLSGEDGLIKAYSNPKNARGIIAASKAESFLSFLSLTGDRALAMELAESKTEPILVKKERKENVNTMWFFYEFRFLAYPLMAVVMGIVGFAYLSFKEEKSLARVNISSMPLSRRQSYLFLSQIFATALIVVIVLGIIFTMTGWKNDVDFVPFFVNIFGFSLSCLGMVFLLTNINSNKDFITGFSSIFPLIIGFLSGVLVEQSFLPSLAVNISSFFPVFYYIKANELAMKGFSKEMLFYLLIEIAFAICYFLAGVFISHEKKRRKVA